MKTLLALSMLFLSGCSVLNPSPYSVDGQKEITIFTDLLSSGWDIDIYDNKVVLIKYTNDSFLLNDVFKLME